MKLCLLISKHTFKNTAHCGLICVIFLLILGCEKPKSVVYKIPKEKHILKPTEIAQPAEPTQAVAPIQQKPLSGTYDPPPLNSNAKEAFTYTMPNGWEESPPTGIRKANFQVNDNHGSAEITVLAFPGDAGGTLSNINRWLKQIGLDSVNREDLDTKTSSREISNNNGIYVKFPGKQESIIGVLLPHDGSTWFFKMQGDTKTVLQQESAMNKFLDSIALIK